MEKGKLLKVYLFVFCCCFLGGGGIRRANTQQKTSCSFLLTYIFCLFFLSWVFALLSTYAIKNFLLVSFSIPRLSFPNKTTKILVLHSRTKPKKIKKNLCKRYRRINRPLYFADLSIQRRHRVIQIGFYFQWICHWYEK